MRRAAAAQPVQAPQRAAQPGGRQKQAVRSAIWRPQWAISPQAESQYCQVLLFTGFDCAHTSEHPKKDPFRRP